MRFLFVSFAVLFVHDRMNNHELNNNTQAFQKETRIVCVGLDAAGKTTVLYKLKLGETITTIPTIGFNVETLQYKNLNLTVWDVGGQDKVSEARVQMFNAKKRCDKYSQSFQ